MALLIEVNENKLNQNDIVVYRGGKWVVQSKAQFNKDLQNCIDSLNDELAMAKNTIDDLERDIDAQQAEMAELKENLAAFAEGVNKKLKEHHDILNVLVGGDK